MDFLLEIGTEELPAQDAWSAIDQLREKAPHLLRSNKLNPTGLEVRVYGTPRRLVVYIEKADASNKLNPTGLEVLYGELAVSLIKSLRFEKSMRWMPGEKLTFSRPIRWLVAMLDDQLIEVEYAGVRSSTISYGPRFLSSPAIKILSAGQYFKQLKKYHVIVDQKQRRKIVSEQNQKLAQEVRGRVPEDRELVDEVTQLVEYPVCIRGEYRRRYLKIPRIVATTVMKGHQRYFPIEDEKGNLLPYFITVANQLEQNIDLIRSGNEKVIEARLADGEFFYQQDRKHKLEHFLPELKAVTFHEKLGSVYEKSERLEKMAPFLSELFELGDQDKKSLERAAHLCKADLATALVREFTSLQGAIGRVYAQEDGESKGAAEAIYEHYLPRFSGDALPRSAVGQVLGVADRIDTLVSFFAVGMRPKGSQDPYALRRTALGLAQVLTELKASLKLSELFELADQFLLVELSSQEKERLIKFVQERFRVYLKETGIRDDVVKAVLAGPKAEDLYLVSVLARELTARIQKKDFANFVQAAKRVHNIVKGVDAGGPVDEELFEGGAEKELYAAYQKIDVKVEKRLEKGDIAGLLDACQKLTEPVNGFFDDVLVMAEDKDLRQNRLNLLFQIDSLFQLLFTPARLTV